MLVKSTKLSVYEYSIEIQLICIDIYCVIKINHGGQQMDQMLEFELKIIITLDNKKA